MGVDLPSLFAQRCDLPDRPDATSLAALPATGGVALLSDRHDRPVQLVSAESLRRVLTARFERPDDAAEQAHTRRADLRAIVRRVWWQPTRCVFETDWTYLRVARRLYPSRYRKLLGFGASWGLRIDPSDRWPAWEVTRELSGDTGVGIGPFARRADATEFAALLVDAFDLCRYEQVLRQAPHGRACAYAEMGRCDAPCDGSATREAYLRRVSASIDFALGDRQSHVERWRAEMADATRTLAFEAAGVAKQRLDRAETASGRAFRFVGDLSRFDWLIVWRLRNPRWVLPFFVRGGAITAGEPVLMSDLETGAGSWLDALDQAPADAVGPERTEQMWLVGHYLFKLPLPRMVAMPRGAIRSHGHVVDAVRSGLTPARSAQGS